MSFIFSFLLAIALLLTPLIPPTAATPSASFLLTSPNGAGFQYELSAPNPEQPVTFQVDGSSDPPAAKLYGYLGGRFGNSTTIITFPEKLVPTTWDENPIKLSAIAIGVSEGEPTGGCGILYGYYTDYDAKGLGFYFNQAQSSPGQDCGDFGVTTHYEISAQIDNAAPSVSLN